MPRPEHSAATAPTHYFDRHFRLEAVKILPGEYYATSRDMLIVTVLGSCVSVCLRDRVSGVRGMNHFMLPGDRDREAGDDAARYGCYAMEILINQLLKLGAARAHLEAKVFGGGHVLGGFEVNSVGERNAAFVLDYLATEQIPVLAQDLLDVHPRKIYFFPGDGRVRVRRLKSLHNDTIFNREKDYEKRLDRSRLDGDIELFS